MDTRFKGQKIQIPAGRIKALAADFVKQDNAKVKVQYIQNHLIVEKDNISEVEAENVEYLDESTSEEQPTKLLIDSGRSSEPFKDTFYANAIHCMIDLYKRKYQDMKGKTVEQIRAMCVWNQIAKDMNECLFRFNCRQIQQKFRQLRAKYFGVASPDEADAFDYFDQLHDLYQDKFIDAIAAGVCKRDKPHQSSTYPDEELQFEGEPLEEKLAQQSITQPHEHNYQAAAAQEVVVGTHQEANDEIAHKEHEFINMVEKELQAIVEGNAEENCEESTAQEILSNDIVIHQHQEEIAAHEEVDNCTAASSQIVHAPKDNQNPAIKRENHREEPTQEAKRIKVEPQRVASIINPHILRLHVKPAQSQQTTATHIVVPSETVHDKIDEEMTLATYNAQQERRHQEKLALLRQSLALQERALEMHQYLMEELIKRL